VLVIAIMVLGVERFVQGNLLENLVAGHQKVAILHLAKLAGGAKSYDKMAAAMKEFVKMVMEMEDGSKVLTDEERNMFSVAYKKIVDAKLSKWRTIKRIEQKEYLANRKSIAKKYRLEIEAELNAVCKEVLSLLHKLVGEADLAESIVYFLTMKGDYNRYLVEVATGNRKVDVTNKAREAYQDAFDISKKDLESTNPVRLRLALNYSVFRYEIMGDHEEAIKIAKDAFDDAIAELEILKDKKYKDSMHLMKLLQDKFSVWSSKAV